jgi:hypothetical protein
MRRARAGYFTATRHPLACLLFVLPLLAAYECGVVWLGAAQPEALRNGADTWMRWALEAFGLHQLYWAPALLAVALLVWSWQRRRDRPHDLLGVWTGMAVESAVFAMGLWGISRGLGPLLDAVGIQLEVAPQADEAVEQVISFLGAGIYEETLFRLLLFTGLIWLFKHTELPRAAAVVLATLASAALFAAAHNVGPYGEKFDGYVFLFLTLAGLYFALLYQVRGFGIAVGAHASYDVLVGVLVNL